jgi:hypothetical protein
VLILLNLLNSKDAMHKMHGERTYTSFSSLALQPGVSFSLPPSQYAPIPRLIWKFRDNNSFLVWGFSPTPNPQPGGPGLHIYIPWRLGGPVIPPGTEYPFESPFTTCMGYYSFPAHHMGNTYKSMVEKPQTKRPLERLVREGGGGGREY